MKTTTYTQYGSSEVIRFQEVEIPNPKDDEIQVRVICTTINRTDCAMLTGKPFIMKMMGILRASDAVQLAGMDVEVVGDAYPEDMKTTSQQS